MPAIEAYDVPYADADAVPVEVKAGSVVLFNGYLLHQPLPSTRPSSFQRALVDGVVLTTVRGDLAAASARVRDA